MRWLVILSDAYQLGAEPHDRLITLNDLPVSTGTSLTNHVLTNNQKWVTTLSSSLDRLGKLKSKKTGHSITSILKLEGGFSFWHASGSTERCVVRNACLEDYYTFLAIIDYIGDQKVDSISVLGASVLLETKLLEHFSAPSGYARGVKFKSQRPSLNRIKNTTELYVHAAITLITLALNIIFTKKYKKTEIKNNATLNFLCYSDNIEIDKNGNFQTTYFRDISEKLKQLGGQIGWYHLYDPGQGLSKQKLIKKLRSKELGEANTSILRVMDGYANLSILFEVIYNYFRLQKSRRDVLEVLDNGHQEQFSPWLFVRDYWLRTVSGGSAIKLLYQAALLKRVVKYGMTDQPCFFLCEGMVWERLFIYYWRKYKKSPIYGYIHSSTKSLDFRLNFYSISDKDYQPWFFLYSENTSTDQLKELGIKKTTLRKLNRISKNIGNKPNKSFNTSTRNNCIGIVMDGIEEIDTWLIETIKFVINGDQALDKFFAIKQHPNVPALLPPELQQRHNVRIADPNFGKFFNECSTVWCSIASSAALIVEAHADKYRYFHKPGHLIRTPLKFPQVELIMSSSTHFLDSINGHNNIHQKHGLVLNDSNNNFFDWELFLK